MPYIITSENCIGRHFKFIEQGNELLTEGYGKQYRGTLALQTFENRDYKRITFADGKNVYGGLFKKLFGIGKAVADNNPIKGYQAGNADYLCHFDFSDAEVRSKKKLLKIQFQIFIYMLICYDFSIYEGTAYILDNSDQTKNWAKQLGIHTFEELDDNGFLVQVKPINYLK